jgi:predicted outer membrane lipoprotein
VKNVVMLVVRILSLGLKAVFGVLRFGFKHTLGVAIAATVGFFLWKKHVEDRAEDQEEV